MKAAIYARVSMDEQNVKTQLQVLCDYCRARGWEVLTEYVDAGYGASEALRPQLNLMVGHARARFFNVLVIWKFDCLFHSVPHVLEVLSGFHTLGIDLVSIHERVDTSSPDKDTVFRLVDAIAELQRALTRKQKQDEIARARAEGKPIGRPRVEIDVERALALWNGGHGLSYRKIALQLGCQPTTVFTALRKAVLKQIDGLSEHV